MSLKNASTSLARWRRLGVVDDLAGADVHARRTGRGAVALVVMGHRPAPTRLHRQRRLGAIERLALGLLVEAEHHRPLRRVQVQPDDVDELRLEVRVVRDLERVDLPRLELMVPPDPRHGVLADPVAGRHQPRRPMRRSVVGPGVQRVVHDRFDRALGQATTCGPDPARSPPPRRRRRSANRARHRRTVFGVVAHRRAISSFATPSAANSSPCAWTTCRCGNDDDRAISSNAARCSADTSTAAATTTGIHPP